VRRPDAGRFSLGDPTLVELQEEVRRFRDTRDWAQFHTLKDLAAAIAVEAAELQEILLWQRVVDEADLLAHRREALEAELADVLIQVMNFALATEIELSKAVRRKLAENEVKYPVEKAHGRSTKYTDL
jgi:NTP pyrophosphatase (non-canonical NTP hydrolase)